jgi:hypothetical protein
MYDRKVQVRAGEQAGPGESRVHTVISTEILLMMMSHLVLAGAGAKSPI